MKNINYILLLLILLAISCAKEFDNPILEEEPIDLVLEKVEADLLIVVRDRSKDGVRSSCIINGETYQSTDMGLIVLDDILLIDKGQTITITAPGYFDEIRYVIPKLDSEMYLEVEMTALESVTGFNAGVGGTISVQDISIDIPANALEDGNGNPYSGEVTIYADKSISALYFSESRTAFHNLSNDNGNPVSLISMGGLNLLLYDENGNPLSLQSGQLVDIQFEVETYEAGTPPIPEELEMRFYDPEIEDWKYMSMAIKSNDIWQAQIGNLGKIMWAQREESTIVEVLIKDENGNGINSALIFVFIDAENPVSFGFTNSEGIVRLHVPVRKEFNIRTVPFCIPDPIRNKVYPSISLSNEVTELEDMIIEGVDYNMMSGQVLDCNGQPASSSLVQVQSKPFEYYVYTDENGVFSFPVLNCQEISVRGYNIESEELGSSIEIKEASPDDILDNTLPFACETDSYFINYVFGNESLSFSFNHEFQTGPWASNHRNTLIAYSTQDDDLNNRTSVLFYSDETPSFYGPNSYDITQLDFYYNVNESSIGYVCEGDCTGKVRVTNITDDVIEGTMENTAITGESITGVFRLPI